MRNRATPDVHERLVVENKLVVLQSVPDTACPANILEPSRVLLAGYLIIRASVSTDCLRCLTGHIRLRKDFVGIETRRCDGRYSDAALEMKHMALLDMADISHLNEYLLRN